MTGINPLQALGSCGVLLLAYSQEAPVSPLRLIQDPGWRFVLEVGMVTHHHGLSLRQLMARKRRLVVLGREVVGRAWSGIVPLLHHLHILLLVLLLLRVRLRVVMGVVLLRRMLRCVGHVHRRRNGDTLRDDRRRSFVDWHLAHLDALG